MDVLKMSPLGDRILVRPPPKQEKTAGGVILAGGTWSHGIVVALYRGSV